MSNVMLSDTSKQAVRVGQVMDSFEAVVSAQEGKPTMRYNRANCTLVEYSDKAVAVFGDTKSIKDELKAMGGRFNSRLTHDGQRVAGWVFSKSQQRRLATYFGLD